MSLFSRLVLFFCFFIFSAESLFSQESFKEKFLEANLLMADQAYELALPYWLDLAKEQPDNANINYKTGYCFTNISTRRREALPYLKKAVDKTTKNYDPNSHMVQKAPSETYYYLAKAYHLDESLDSAEKYFNDFLALVSKKHMLRPNTKRDLETVANARELIQKPVKVNIQSLGDQINSPGKDFGPVVSPDENAIYFTSRRLRLDNSNDGIVERSTGSFFEDIYVSYKDYLGNWLEPELLNISRLNNHEATIGLSSDGQQLFIYRSYKGAGYLYSSELNDQGNWTPPAELTESVNSKNNETHVAISRDGQRMYFVSDRKGGFGGKDLYRCIKLPNGEWSLPQNLGETVNTPYDEEGPFIHPDDHTLYFSSQGHKSIGGYDIFFTKWLGENDWTAPKNLGYPINTTDDDVFYITTPDGKRSYYSSTRKGGFGETDIYMVERISDSEEKVDLSGFALLKGYILVPRNAEIPDGTKIVITKKSDGELIGVARPLKRNGSFVFIIPAGDTYHVEYSVKDVIHFEEDIVVPISTEYKEFSREIILRPFVIGDSNSYEVVVLTDDILSKKIKWQLRLTNPDQRLPFGVKVNYLDRDGNIVHTEYVSKDGYFSYRKLGDEGEYDLQFIIEDDVSEEFNIVLFENGAQEPTTYVTRDNRLFVSGDRLAELESKMGAENIKKWKIRFSDGASKLPLGIKVNFVDDQGEIIYTTFVNEDGTFEFRKLLEEGARLRLEYEGEIDGNLIIVLEEDGKEIEILVSSDNLVFQKELMNSLATKNTVEEMPVIKKWRIHYQGNKRLPLGTQIEYLDDKGEVIYSTFINEEGSFAFWKLPPNEMYRIRVNFDGETDGPLVLILEEGSTEIVRLISGDNKHFTESLETAQALAASNAIKEGPAIQKWRILYPGSKRLPLGTRIEYLDAEGKVLHTAFINEEGSFAFWQIPNNEDYMIKVNYDGEFDGDLVLILEQGATEITRLISKDNKHFADTVEKACSFGYEEPLAAAVAKERMEENTPKDKSTTIKPDAQEKSPEAKKGEMLGTEKAYQCFFGYNKTEIPTHDKSFTDFIKLAAEKASKNGKLTLSLEASASMVPTKTFGSNELLASKRAEGAKKVLVDALTKAGIPPNHIIIAPVTPLVQGPEYKTGNIRSRPEYEAFQYIKVLIK